MTIALICPADRWLQLLTARARRQPFAFLLGKGEPPQLNLGALVYVVAFSKLRFRAPLTARRMEYPGPGPTGVPCGGLRLGVYGWRVELDVAAAEGVAIDRDFGWWPRWRDVGSTAAMTWRGPPGPPRRGEAPTVPAADEERPWPGWCVEAMPKEIGDQAARIGGPPPVAAPAPVVASKSKSAGKGKSALAQPVTRGLFDGLI